MSSAQISEPAAAAETAPPVPDWVTANQRYLAARVALVRALLERYLADTGTGRAAEPVGKVPDGVPDDSELTRLKVAVEQARDALPAPAALDRLSRYFGLSDFESDVLVFTAAIELDGSFAALCARAHGASTDIHDRTHVTFSLALVVLRNAHWSALRPDGPLRYWMLVEPGPGNALTSSPLRIDERVLHYLSGVATEDARLAASWETVRRGGDLPPSHAALVRRLTRAWDARSNESPAAQLIGADAAAREAIAQHLAADLGLALRKVRTAFLPSALADLERLLRMWNRECVLGGCLLLLDCEYGEASGPAEVAIEAVVEGYEGLLIVSRRTRGWFARRSVLTVEVGKPTTEEQRALWLDSVALAEDDAASVDDVVGQFDLSAPTIRAAAADACARRSLCADDAGPGLPEDNVLSSAFSDILWQSCREQARPRLDGIAQRIAARARWADLVVPPACERVLRTIATQVRARHKVYDEWEFAPQNARARGITALFAGASGTGKTMAAEVLAGELRLDLFRIDLASIVSKYIGETEKNLSRVFDAAEDGGIILLFDEADALFGKRSDVKDSHDRYANIEVSYLLQRMESYSGLAILTTNLRDALDTAFVRRLRFIVDFPFPEESQRERVWRQVFPGAAPVEGLNFAALARLNLSPGLIRNIALNAAFLAASDGTITMRHVFMAAQTEHEKLGRPFNIHDFRRQVM